MYIKILPFFLILVVHNVGVQGHTQADERFKRQPAPQSYSPLTRNKEWAASSVENLALSVVSQLYNEQGLSYNIIVSPFSIWSVLLLLFEASAGSTKDELKRAMIMNNMNENSVGQTYNSIHNTVLRKSPEVEISSVNLLLTSTTDTVRQSFLDVLQNMYKAQVRTVNLKNKDESIRKINQLISSYTNGRIRNMVQKNEINDTQVFMANAAFFKARWMTPFNKSLTSTDVFKAERDQLQGNVNMMYQRLPLRYDFNVDLQSQIVVIPYAENAASMVVILPSRKTSLGDVLAKLKNKRILDILQSSVLDLEDVDLYLPRMIVKNELTLNKVLSDMGINMMFSSDAEFPAIAQDVYVSRVVHNAEIETAEEGTVASAATVADLSYKNPVVKFHANRPFIYYIIETHSKVVLFMGTFTNPNT